MSALHLLAIGKRMRLARLEARVTLKAAGRHVSRTRQSVAGWESGETEIGVLLLGSLADLYGVTTDYIVFGRAILPGGVESSEAAEAEMNAAFVKARGDASSCD